MHTSYTRIKDSLLRCCLLLFLISSSSWAWAEGGPSIEPPPYGEQKVVFEFFFDNPVKVGTALYWLRSLFNTLEGEPYDIAPDFLSVKVVMHGTGVVTLAKKNYKKYTDLVERMRYYSALGVDFRVCAQALKQYGYKPKDMQDFVTVVPSAIPDLVHWQLQGYALIIPQVFDKLFTVDELR